MSRTLALTAIVASLALAACGDDDDETASPAAPSGAEGDPGAGEGSVDSEEKASGAGGSPGGAGGGGSQNGSGTELVATDSEYGSILFDSERRAIYVFDKETSDASQCYGDCAEAWPPVLTGDEPEAGRGVDPELLGTTERDDGSTQVTYDGQPLYYYVDDPPGQVLCQGVEEFGGLWLVVGPSGEAVR